MEELTQDGAQLARTMLMAAMQLAESMARVQAQRAWMAQGRSTAQGAQAQQQIAAKRDAARMIFRPLTDERYWHDAPQLDRVVQAYMTAASWAEHDSEARAAVQLIKRQAEERWGRAVSDAMHVPEPAGIDHSHDLAETSLTEKQRTLLIDLGIEPGEDFTKAEASQAIRERLQASSRADTPRHHATKVAETALVEGIARQADVRLERLGDVVSPTGGVAADAEAEVARRQSVPAIAQPIQRSLQAARGSEGKMEGRGAVATARFTKERAGHDPFRSGRRDTGEPGRSPELG